MDCVQFCSLKRISQGALQSELNAQKKPRRAEVFCAVDQRRRFTPNHAGGSILLEWGDRRGL